MNQELIDLLRGELGPEQARDLNARLESDPALSNELTELERIFSFMRQGEEIEAPAEMRAGVMAAAERATRPSFVQQLRALPGLIRYRFQQSLAFRVAAVSLTVHLIAMAILFQMTVPGKSDNRFPLEAWVNPVPPDLRPADSFVRSLSQRRLPHAPRLMRVGLKGHEELIQRGIERILASQAADGTFGDAATTGYSTLALLAEGDCSTAGTRRGRAIQRAVRQMLQQKMVHGSVLAALVEDWTLSFTELNEYDRIEYAQAILRLVRDLGSDEASLEGLAIAARAHIPMSGGRDLGVLAADPSTLLEAPASRLSATAVLARGQKVTSLDQKVEEWLRALFLRAKAVLSAGKAAPLAVLTLQAPYRL